MYYTLVICLIQAQSIIFQDTTGAVYTINDKVHKQMGDTVGLPGDQVLVLIDGDGRHCQPDPRILPARNVRILLTSFPRGRSSRRWLVQDIKDSYASYVVGPWQWDELAITSFVTSVLIYFRLLMFHSIFLSQYDITLHRLRKAAKFCGFNRRQSLGAATSPENLGLAENKVFRAIRGCQDIGVAVADVTQDHGL